MNRDDIIRMAQKAYGDWYPNAVPPELERFAALVAAHERETLLKDGWRQCAVGQRTTQFCSMTDAAVKAEREECARVCERLPAQQDRDVRDECAAAIRARGNP